MRSGRRWRRRKNRDRPRPEADGYLTHLTAGADRRNYCRPQVRTHQGDTGGELVWVVMMVMSPCCCVVTMTLGLAGAALVVAAGVVVVALAPPWFAA